MAYAPIDYIGAMHAAINLHAVNNAVVDTQVVQARMDSEGRTAEGRTTDTTTAAAETRADARSAAAGGRGTAPAAAGSGGGRPADQARPATARIPATSRRRGCCCNAPPTAAVPQAALILGGTYDPDVLREIGVLGFASNPAMAREWYQKAAGTRRQRSRAVGSIAWRRQNAKAQRGVRGGSIVGRPGRHLRRSRARTVPEWNFVVPTDFLRLRQFGTRPDSQPEL